MIRRDKGENPLPKRRSMKALSFRQCLPAQCTSWATDQRVYKIFLIEKPHNIFCALMSHRDIYKSLQKPWRDTSPSEERSYACISGQAMDVLVREEDPLAPGHSDTLPTPVLLWAFQVQRGGSWHHHHHRVHTASGRSPTLIHCISCQPADIRRIPTSR